MDELLFTWYGLYPTWYDENTFSYQQKNYVIEKCNLNEKQLSLNLSLNEQVKTLLSCQGYQVVPNLKGQILTQQYIVLMIEATPFGLAELFKQQLLVCPSKDLIMIREAWLSKIEFVKKSPLNQINPYQMALVDYHLGLARTAVSYLNELIFSDFPSLQLNCLCHRRLPSLDFKWGLDPLNYIVDHRSRDVVMLYFNRLISFEELLDIFTYQNYQSEELYYFWCRLIFPTWFFDWIIGCQDYSYVSEMMNHHHHLLSEIYDYLKTRIPLKTW